MFQKDNNCQKILHLQTLNYLYLLKDTKSRYIFSVEISNTLCTHQVHRLFVLCCARKIELKGRRINKESPRNTQQLDYRAR